jgi:asparagine synthase (glutamine-hydrolysing)
MPGMVGLVTKMPREWAEPQLLRMVETLRHESFYATGTWIDKVAGVYVGWAALKNSFSDGMPLCNEREDVCLVFSGEEFSEPRTACRLKERGHVFEVEGPSYLVHAYEEDASFPAGLNGRFHGLLTDQSRGTTTLFNDRYGMHRIYYHESKEALYFAAEAKAILAVRPELRRANLQSLGEFVACGCVLDNRTLFEGIHVLPPAAAWVFRDGSIERKNSYFQPREWEDQAPLEPGSYYQELREVFSRNLPRYFDGRERIGMSLTGGLDTRMIMAWQESPLGSLPCYSFGGTFRDCQDVVLARQVASVCGQPHEVIPVGEEFLSLFPHYAERTVYLTDGCADVCRSADLYVNERAREIAPVRMTGNYGGEVLRRVRAFKPVEPLPGLFHPELLPYVHRARETYAGLIRGHPLSFSVFRQAPWHHYGLLALEQTQLSLRTPYLDNDLVRTVFRAPQSAWVNNDICLRLIADGDATLRQIRTDRGLGQSGGRLSAAALRHLLGFTFKAEYAYDYGMPQSVARIDHLLSPLRLERLFLGRHKFAHYRVWYRDMLSGYVREMLLDQRTLSRPYLQEKKVETVVNGHLKGDRNYTTAIHTVLSLELLHRLFFDSLPSSRPEMTQQLASDVLAGKG